MNTYLLEFSTLLGLFGLCYLIFLRGISNYGLQRHYMLGSIFVSILLPLLPNLFQNDLLVYSVVLPEVNIIGYGATAADNNVLPGVGTDWLFYGLVLMGLISLVFALRFIYALFQIAQIMIGSPSEKTEGFTILRSASAETPFSFFNYIIIPDNLAMDKAALQIIIDHERLHISFNHSVEKILMELFKVLVWWHPVTWMYKKELDLIHEYQVDDAMIQNMESSLYKQTLLELILPSHNLRIVNPISSNIKKRIQKMNQQKIKNGPVRSIALIAIIAIGTLFIHSCQEVSNDEIIQTNNVSLDNPEQNTYEITSVDTFTTFDYDTYEETIQIAESKQTVYITPDKMPLFPGCDLSMEYSKLEECSTQKLLEFIYNNVYYPEESRKAGVEGMVVVKFVVGDKGWIFNLEFLKSPDPLLEEAVRKVLQKMNKHITWIPGESKGEEVNVQYTLPVKFKLEG